MGDGVPKSIFHQKLALKKYTTQTKNCEKWSNAVNLSKMERSNLFESYSKCKRLDLTDLTKKF